MIRYLPAVNYYCYKVYKKSICIILCFISFVQPAQGQRLLKKYVKDNAKPIQLQGDDYSDLNCLGEAIGNKRIVMLGELSHGDGTAFQMKGRIIKYLHQNLGFNVLAFESDFFGLNAGWEKFRNHGISPDTLIKWSIFPVWTTCEQCKETFDYVIKESLKSAPLQLAGFDCQLSSTYTYFYLMEELKNFIELSNIDFYKSSQYPQYLNLLKSFTILRDELKPARFDSLQKGTEIILQQLKGRYPVTDFYLKVLESLNSYCCMYLKTGQSQQIRDSRMADNLLWLANIKYPDEKIIVWAHNGHISSNADSSLYKGRDGGSKMMGYHFTSDNMIKAQTYILGFTQYSGEGNWTTISRREKVTKPLPKSVEVWLKKAGYSFSFIDFNRFNTLYPRYKTKFYMKTVPTITLKSNWNKSFDGLVFIEEMNPCIFRKW